MFFGQHMAHYSTQENNIVYMLLEERVMLLALSNFILDDHK